MIAISIGVEVITGSDEVDAPRVAAHFEDAVRRAIASADDLCLRDRRLGPIFGKYGDHATGSIAIQRGEWAAQDFATLRGHETEASRLALTVGHGCRNPILK